MGETPLGYYKWYPRDFATSTVVRSMSFTARAIYRELLDIQWESGCLPNAKRLLSIIGANDEQWQEFAEYFDELFPNGRNPKLDEMRKEALERQAKRKESGSKGGVAKQKGSKRKASAKQMPSQTETETYIEKDKKEVLFDCWKEQKDYNNLNEIWPRYQEHRKALKINPYTQAGLQSVIDKMNKNAPEGLAAKLLVIVIKRALEGNWQGLPPGVITEEAEKLKASSVGAEPEFQLVEVDGELTRVEVTA